MKIILTREHKAIMLQALNDGFVYDEDLNKIKGIDTLIPDKPMSRLDYEALLNRLKCEPDGEETANE